MMEVNYHFAVRRYRVRYRFFTRMTPGMDAVDGKVFGFTHSYNPVPEAAAKKEVPMLPADPAWPEDAPKWVALADLELVDA